MMRKMNQILVMFLFVFGLVLPTGCANTHKGRAIQLVVASDAAADGLADGYKEFVSAKVVECDAKLDPEKGHTKSDVEECLGLADPIEGERFLKAVETLVALQLVIKIAVECGSNPLKIPKEFQKECVEGKKADWQAMAASLASAWKQLAPFFEAVRGFAGK